MNPGFHYKMFSKRFHSSLALSIRLFCTLIFTFLWFSSALNAAEPPTIELTPEEQAWAEANPELVNISSALRSRVQLSDQERRWLETKQDVPVRVGDYPPFFFVSNDSPQGLSIDYVRMICSAFDMNCRFVTGIPVSESFSLMQEPGGIALQPAWQSNAEREKIAIFTTPYLISPFVIFKRKEETDPIRSMEDLAGKRVVVEKGYAIHRLLEQKHPELKLVEVKFSSEALETLSAGGADAYISSMLAGNYMAIQHGIPNVEVAAQTPFKPNIMSIAVRRDHPELASLIDKSIKAITPLEHTTIKQRWTTGFEGTFSPPPVRVSLTPEEKAWLAEHPVITLTTLPNWQPFVITDEKTGELSGIDVEFIKLLNQRLGDAIRIETYDWATLVQMSKEHQVDGFFPAAISEDRKPYLVWTKVYNSTPLALVTLRDAPDIKKWSDLAGKKVAMTESSSYIELLGELAPEAEVVIVKNIEEQVPLLAESKVDAVLNSAPALYHTMRSNNVLSLMKFQKYYISDNHGQFRIAIRNDEPLLLSILNKGIDSIAEEEFNVIKNKWVPKEILSGSPLKAASKTKAWRELLSENERTWLQQGHIVRARVSYWPPLMFREPKPSGIAVDYLKHISTNFGFKVEFIASELNFTDSLHDLQGDRKHYDLMLTLKKTPEREKEIAFTDNYLVMPWVIFTRDKASFISSLEDLKGKTVSVEQSYVMADMLEKDYPSIKLLKVPSSLDALQAVATAQADAYIGNLSNATWLVREHNLDNLKIAAPTPFGDHDNAMGVRKDWPELASIISKGLAAMTPDEQHAIKNRWLTTVKTETDYALLWKSMLALILIVAAIIYWNRVLRRQVRKRTAELSESESRFRATFEQAAVGIAHVSPEGQFLRLNQKFCEIVGYSEKEVLKLKFQDITHPDDLDADLHLFQELLDGKSDSYTMEKRYIRKDGSLVWISLTVKILRNEDGSPRWFVSVIEDISDRIRIQDEVHKSYEFLNHLTKTIPDAIFSVKLPERIVSWCTDTYGILGYEAQECIGKSTEKLYPSPVEAQKMGALIDNAISNENETVQTEIMLRRKNGEIFPVEAKLAFQKEAGRVVSVTALLRDISERKLAEKKLQENHDYLKHLLSSIPDAVFRVKLPERVIDWVEDYSHIMGASDVKEMYGQPTRNYFASEDEYNAFGEIQRQTIENGKDFMRHEIIVRRSDGKTFPAEVTSSFFRENGTVKYVTALVRDITDRKEAEKKILDYQKHLKALASQLTLVEERERRRIAADLHDDIGQTLAMSRLQLAAAIRACDCTGSKHHGMLEEISATLLKAIQDTRQLIFELGSAAIHEIGLGAAIAEWIEEKMKSLDDEIDFDLVDNLADDMLEEDQRVILFRNIRELLTNTIKHARASKVEILLESDDHEIHITVQDDGIGFNPELISGEFNQEGGYGIFSIEERMADLGGRLEIDSAPHKGCCITMSLPIES